MTPHHWMYLSAALFVTTGFYISVGAGLFVSACAAGLIARIRAGE